MIHAIFKPRMKWATSITTIATTLALTLTPTQAIAGGQAANNTVGEAIDTLKASIVTVLGGQAGISDQGVKEITTRPFIRIFGSDRYHTAWTITGSVFKNEFNPQGRVMKKIYVASGDNPADALAASNLKDGALLLAPPRLSPEHGVTWEQATYIGFAVEPSVTSITVLGGQGAVEDRVVRRSLGNASVSLPVNRIYGANRYETAAQIAKQAYPSGVKKVYLARGDNPADALAASNLKDGVLLLAPPNLDNPGVTTVVSDAIKTLGASSVTVLGGQSAVPDSVIQALTTLPTSRIAGTDRYETAAQIAKQAWPGGVKKVYLARGDQPADALAASNLKDGALLLAPPKPNDNIAAHEQTTCQGEPHFTDEDHEAAQQEMLRLVNNARTKAGLSPVTISPTAVKFANDYARNPLERHSTQEERNQYSPDIWGENLLFFDGKSSEKNPLEMERDICEKDSRTLLLEATRDAFTRWWDSDGHRKAIMYPKNASIGFGYRLDYRVAESHSKYALAFVEKSTSVGSKSEKTIPEKKSESNPTEVEFTTTRNGRHDYEVQLAEHQQKTCEVHQRSRRPISVKVLGGDPELVCAKFGIKYDWVSDISGVSSGSVGLRDDLPRQGGESSWVYCNPEFVVNCPPGVSTVKPE